MPRNGRAIAIAERATTARAERVVAVLLRRPVRLPPEVVRDNASRSQSRLERHETDQLEQNTGTFTPDAIPLPLFPPPGECAAASSDIAAAVVPSERDVLLLAQMRWIDAALLHKVSFT